MRVFVTGASGFIGSAVVPALLSAGHQVLGLARSDAAAKTVAAMGAAVHRGDLHDFESLRVGATESEGVIHLGFIHDFNDFTTSLRVDRQAIETMGAVLEGSGRPLVIASGLLGLAPGQVATEETPFSPGVSPRAATAVKALGTAQEGVRVSLVRLPPTVHGQGDHGFVSRLVEIAREKKVSGYIGSGANRWPAVHRLDAARLFVLALEKARAGTSLHAIADEGVPTRTIAEIIGKQLGLPTVSIDPESAAAHFGWLGMFFGMDQPATSQLTRDWLRWAPTHPSLVADLEAGHYTL